MTDVPLQEDPKATVFEHIEVQRRGSITIITIARPAARNALHVPAHFELARAIDDFAADDQAWVAIITGSGDRAFCAGQDRSEEHTSELQSLMRNSYAVFCLKQNKTTQASINTTVPLQ